MKLAIIVAAAKNGVIGNNNQLPWHLPQDLKYFKSVTLGKPVIMGRKTYESIGRPLPGRTNIVVTRSADWKVDGVVVVNSIEQALEEASKAIAASAAPVEEAMIIGGAEIYRTALPMVNKVYLTRVEVEIEGDAFFPALPEAEWQLASTTAGDEQANLAHQFLVYERAR
ncbi:MAG: dihydrofolate reductase [Cellvibrio sp.]|uniref:dihydrofolate reductase n=1 Tax=Cellvibrio sp. TaxID=1965322 RepID=UPI0031B24C7B